MAKTTGKPESLSDEFEIGVLYGDRHATDHSPRNDRILLEIIKDINPDYIFDLGDPVNAACLGKYKKRHKQLVGLRDEIENDQDWRARIKKVSPDSVKIILDDNHLVRRLDDFVCDGNWWLDELGVLKPANILSLEEHGWTMVPEWKWKNTVLMCHGDAPGLRGTPECPVNKCRQLVRKSHLTVIKAHSHSTGIEIIPSGNGEFHYAVQIGALMDITKTDYVKHMDFSMASESAAIIYLSRKTTSHVIIPIVFHSFGTIVDGRLYR